MATAAITGEEVLIGRSPVTLALHATGCLVVGVASFLAAHPLVARMELRAADPLMQAAQRLAPEGLLPLALNTPEPILRSVLAALALCLIPLSLPWLRGAMYSVRHRQPDGNVTASLAVITAVAWTLITAIAFPRLTAASMPADPLLPSAALAAAILFAAQAMAQRGLRRIRDVPEHIEDSEARHLTIARGHLPPGVSASLRHGRIAVYCSVAAAIASAALWTGIGSLTTLPHGITGAVAVLFATAPVAFTLSTVLPWVSSLQSLWVHGVRSCGADVLRTLSTVERVYAGANGAVTTRQATVKATAMIGVPQRELLRDAAALELPVDHPIAEAIVKRAESLRSDLPVISGFTTHPGEGVQAKLDGRETIVGSPSLLERFRVDTSPVAEELSAWEESGWIPVLLATEGRLGGAIAIERVIAPGSAEAVRRLRGSGIDVKLVSGGSEAACGAYSRELELPEYPGSLSTAEREGEVMRSAAQQVVAAIGDAGDREWMRAAHVRILSTDQNTAPDDGNQIVTSREAPLAAMAMAVTTAKRAEAAARRNGRHALAHHVIFLPLVSGVIFPLSGWLPPWWAAWIISPMLGAAAAAIATVAVVVKGNIPSDSGRT